MMDTEDNSLDNFVITSPYVPNLNNTQIFEVENVTKTSTSISVVIQSWFSKYQILFIFLVLITFFLCSMVTMPQIPSKIDNSNKLAQPLQLSLSSFPNSNKASSSSGTYYEVVDGSFDIKNGVPVKRILAYGTYIRNVKNNGWHHLTVRAGEGFSSSPTNKESSEV